VSSQFSKRLKQQRIRQGLSQRQLAKLCRLSQSAISNYENGTRQVGLEIFTLARVLKVSPMWLAEGRGPRMTTPGPNQAEPNQSYLPTLWPFQTIAPEELQTLRPNEKAIVEQTLTSLIKALKDNREVDPANTEKS